MKCSSCGADNTTTARYCCMCGKPVGDADVIPPSLQGISGQSPRQSQISVSMAALGIEPNRKTWGAFTVFALLFAATGAVAAYMFVTSDAEPTTAQGSTDVTEDAQDVEVGEPLPIGEEPPEPDDKTASGDGVLDPWSDSSSKSVKRPARPRRKPKPELKAMKDGTVIDPWKGKDGDSNADESADRLNAFKDIHTPPKPLPPPPGERDLEAELYASRVRYVIQKYYGKRAQSCFNRATRNRDSVHGSVIITTKIQADGSVSNARATKNTTGSPELGTCLAGQVKQWRFPQPPRPNLDFNIPFSL